MEDPRLLYTMKDLLPLLGIGKTLCYQLIQDRTFPKITINGRYYFPKDKLEKWINQQQGKEIITKG